MTVLFKAQRLVGLNYLPHEVAANGVSGVFETDLGTEAGKEDCVAFAAGMIGELIANGEWDAENLRDDAAQVRRIAGQPLEDFALEAYEIVSQHILFFVLLSAEVQKKMVALLASLPFPTSTEYVRLPDSIPVVTLSDVEQIYNRAESTLAGFLQKP